MPFPDLHMTINISQEIIQTICVTISFAVLCWATVKIISIIKTKTKND